MERNLCERTRIVGKDWNRGWNKVLATTFVNQIIAYIYIRDIAERRREKKEGEGHSRNGLDDVRNK